MKGYDAFAGVIKSGGKTRRAAKMVILNADHPGHRRVHQLQGRGREEGVGAHRRRLRRLVHRAGLFVGVLPELEQQRPGDRRVHARGAGRRRWETSRCATVGDGHLPRANLMRLIAEGTHVCGDRAWSPTRRSTNGTPARRRIASTPAIRARRTCSSTIRPRS